MNKMLKKIALFLIGACVCASLFAGCAPGRGGPGKIEVSETLKKCELKIVLPADSKPADCDNVVKAINDELALSGKPYTVKFEFVGFGTYWSDLENKARDGYDLAMTHIDRMTGLIGKSVLMDIQPYLEKWGPLLLEKNPDYAWKQVTDYKTGAIYAIPRHTAVADYKYPVQIRKDWMEQAGLEKVTTVAEFDEYLSYINNAPSIAYEEDGVTRKANFYALTPDYYNIHLLREIAPTFYFPIDEYEWRPVYIDTANPEPDGTYKVKSFYETEEFREWANKSREYYDAGYVNPSVTANPESAFYNNLTGTVWCYAVKQSERIDAFKEKNPAGDLYTAYFNQDEPKRVFVGADNMMSVLSYSQNPNEAIDFMNWTRTQKGHDLVTLGVRNVNYFLTTDEADQDPNGNAKYTFVDPNDPDNIIPLEKRYSMGIPSWALNDVDLQRWSVNLDNDYISMIIGWESDTTDEDSAFAGGPNYIVTDFCGFNIDMTDNAVKTAMANLQGANIDVNNFLSGRTSLSEWDDTRGKTKYQVLLDNLQTYGIDEFIAALQVQVDDYIRAMKK